MCKVSDGSSVDVLISDTTFYSKIILYSLQEHWKNKNVEHQDI